MTMTLGIDLASKPARTALCSIAWNDGVAEVRALARARWNGTPVDDELLSSAIRGQSEANAGPSDLARPVKTAIDAPFGWPEPFVQAIQAHHRLEPWPGMLNKPRAEFERRTTDRFVRDRTGKLPLSVSTDRIAYCAMRCAVILGDLAQHLEPPELARDGSGLVVESYPDAALRCWLPAVWAKAREDSYKGDGETAHARRERLLTALLAELGPRFTITAQQHDDCVRSDDCLDALVCALLARAADRAETIPPKSPDERRLAHVEGWIHLPVAGSLPRLVLG